MSEVALVDYLTPNPEPERKPTRHISRDLRLIGCGVLLSFVLIGAALGTNNYLQSNAFCTQTCHSVMAPQALSHRASMHGQIPCVSCHIGEGAVAQVRAKWRGVQHVWSLLSGSFSRPIRATVPKFRTTSASCLMCHQPENLPNSIPIREARYRHDTNSSRLELALTLRLTPEGSRFGTSGIGWHMSEANKVTYAAADPDAQQIPWIRVRRADGTTATYVKSAIKLDPEQLTQLPRYEMHCSACHRGAAHAVGLPEPILDHALAKGVLPTLLPHLKRHTLQALNGKLASHEAMHDAIGKSLVAAYQTPTAAGAGDHQAAPRATGKGDDRAARDPSGTWANQAALDSVVAFADTLYDASVFAVMNFDWHSYPEQLGHRFSPGCFRCHDGLHVAADGKVLERDCSNLCHSAPSLSVPMSLGAVPSSASGQWHPWQLPSVEPKISAHERLLCADCHSGTSAPKIACEDCHHPPGWR